MSDYAMFIFGKEVVIDNNGITFETYDELFEKLRVIDEMGLSRDKLHLQPYAVNQAKYLSLIDMNQCLNLHL